MSMSYAPLNVHHLKRTVDAKVVRNAQNDLAASTDLSFRLNEKDMTDLAQLFNVLLRSKGQLVTEGVYIIESVMKALRGDLLQSLGHFLENVARKDLYASTMNKIKELRRDYVSELNPILAFLDFKVSLVKEMGISGLREAENKLVQKAARRIISAIKSNFAIMDSTDLYPDRCLKSLVQIQQFTDHKVSNKGKLPNDTIDLLGKLDIEKMRMCVVTYSTLLERTRDWMRTVDLSETTVPNLAASDMEVAAKQEKTEYKQLKDILRKFYLQQISLTEFLKGVQSLVIKDQNLVREATLFNMKFVIKAELDVAKFLANNRRLYIELLYFYQMLNRNFTSDEFEKEARNLRIWRIRLNYGEMVSRK